MVICLSIRHVLDVADDTFASEIGRMDPQDLLVNGLVAFSGAGTRVEISKVFFPAGLADPFAVLALELPVNFLAVRASEPEQCAQAPRVRCISGAESDRWQGHEQN